MPETEISEAAKKEPLFTVPFTFQKQVALKDIWIPLLNGNQITLYEYMREREEAITDFKAKLAEAREDTARLDWMFQTSYMRHRLRQFFGLKLGDSIREGIDTIQAETPPVPFRKKP